MPSARGIRAGAAYVELSVDDRLTAGLKRAQASLKAFASSTDTLGRTLLAAATIALAPLTVSAKTFASFSDQMAIVQSVSGASEKDFARLNDRAKELGRTTSFTAAEVASAMVALGRAGFSANEILSAIAGTLDLARAGALDLGEATTIMADVSRSFGLAADQAGRVGDVLAKTANIANTDVQMVGEAMKYVAASANLSGQSLERVSGALAVLANRGLKGEMAGASLAMVLTQLAGKDVQDKLSSLGVKAVDTQGNLRDLLDILRALGGASAKLGNAQKLSLFKEMFDQRGMRSAILLSQNAAEWQKLTQIIAASSGTAATVAKRMDDTLGGSFRMMMSAVEGVQIAIGEVLEKTLRRWMDQVAVVAQQASAWISANRGLVISALKLAVVVGALGGALIGLSATSSALAYITGTLAAGFSLASTVVGSFFAILASLVTPAGLVTAAIAGVGLAILQMTGTGSTALAWLGSQFDDLKERVSRVFRAVGDALAGGDILLSAKVLWAALRLEWAKGLDYIFGGWETLYLIAADSFDRLTTSAFSAWRAIKTAALDALTEICRQVFESGQTIAETFWSAIHEMMEAYASLVDKITTAGYALHILDDQDLVATEQTLKRLRQGMADLSGASQDFYKSRLAGLESDQQTRYQEQAAADSQAEADLAGRKQTREQAYLAALRASEQSLAQARQEWQDVVAEAANTRQTAAAGNEPSATSSLIDSLKNQLMQAGQATLDAAQRAVSVEGTFNAAAILGLQAGNVAERTAKATEETARNTKRLVEEAKLGGLTFA